MKYGDIDGYVDGSFRVVSSTFIDGAFAQYKLNDNAANTTVLDSGYGANDGVSSRNTSSLTTTGKVNEGFLFSESQPDSVQLDNLAADITNDTVGSISVWVYRQTSSTGQYVCSFGQTSAYKLLYITSDSNNKVIADLYNSGTALWTLSTANNTFPLNTWTHLVLVQDGICPRLYINGSQADAVFSSTTSLSSWISAIGSTYGKIGAFYHYPSLQYDGFNNYKYDDFRYYKYPLTAAQVASIYNAGSGSESNVMTAPTNSITVSGLDGNTDEEYEIYCYYRNTLDNTAVNPAMWINDDRSVNYVVQQLYGADTTITGSRDTAYAWGVALGSVDDNESYCASMSKTTLYAKAGYERACITELAMQIGYTDDPEIVRFISKRFTGWSNTTDNITSLVFTVPSGNWAEGSRIIVLKKCNTGMPGGDMEVNGKFLQEPAYLYAHYKLNELAGTTVYDCGRQQSSSGNGTASTDISNLSVAGKIDRAFEFNGSSEYATIPYTNLTGNSTGSIAFWYYRATGSSNGTAFAFANSGNNAQLSFRPNSSNFDIAIRSDGTLFIYYQIPQVLDSWTHICLVQDGKKLRVYQNGAEINPTKTTDTTPSAWFSSIGTIDNGRLGCINYGGGGNSQFFGGKLEDWRYYQHGLSPQEVKWVYEIGQPPAQALVTGAWEKIREFRHMHPYVWYTMEDNAASTAVVDYGTASINAAANTNTSNLTDTGKINNGFTLSAASSEHIVMSSFVSSVNTDAYGSFAYWINPSVSTSGGGILYWRNNVTTNSLIMQMHDPTNDYINMYMRDNAGTTIYDASTPNGAVPNGSWTHVCWVQDGYTRLRCYINGSEVTLVENTKVNPRVWFSGLAGIDTGYFGSRGSDHWMNASFDDFRYYRKALTPYEVSEIYNGGLGTQRGAGMVIPDYFSFTGLNGDTDVLYKIIMRSVSGGGANSYTFMRFNHGYGYNSNYGYQTLDANNATFSASRQNGTSNPYEGLPVNQLTGTGTHSLGETTIFVPSNFPKVGISEYMGTGSSVVEVSKLQGLVYSRLEKVTSLDFRVTTGSYAHGTFCELWRLNL